MPRRSDEQALTERFSKRYARATSNVMREIECSVRGCDYGGTSWTTRPEADAMGEMLALGPDKRLLEVGAGTGWPGLYLAQEHGCDVALIDLPPEGLGVAKQRAADDQLPGACWAAVASGAALPFANGSFHAVMHSDVLCCLVEKQAVLTACRDAIRGDGQMVFSVILVTPGLSATDHQRGLAGGPAFIGAAVTYPEMIRKAGWKILKHADLTEQFLTSVRLQIEQEEAHEEELTDLLGPEETAALWDSRRARLAALENGLIRRELFHAVPA